jgi:ribosomal-protein-alanine N-acetyltransferase
MRVINKYGQLTKVVCNSCKKEIMPEREIWKEDFISIDKKWGYFSKKDGENHHLDLCEDCYDRWVSSLQVAVTVVDETELLS